MSKHYRQSCYDDHHEDYGYLPTISEDTERCFECEYQRRKEDLRWKNVVDEWDGRRKDVKICVWCIASDWPRWRDA